MDSRKRGITTIDAYIATFTIDVQEKLRNLRAVIQESAPDATEKISYQMPTFYLGGNLVHFAAYKNHIGFYPASSGVAHFKDELSAYKTSKGAIQFPLNEFLPFDLITRIVKFRVEENLQRAKADTRKKP